VPVLTAGLKIYRWLELTVETDTLYSGLERQPDVTGYRAPVAIEPD